MKGIGSGHRDGLLARAFHVKTGFALPLRPKHSFIESASQHHGLQHVEQRIAVQPGVPRACCAIIVIRSEEHTSELQSLMRISYAVFCLKKKKKIQQVSI